MEYGDIVVKKLAGLDDQLLTVDNSGLIISTGLTVADISGSDFDPTDLETQIAGVSAASDVNDATLQAQIDLINAESYVNTVNSASGDINIVGGGTVTISTVGSTVTVSGGSGDHNLLTQLQGGSSGEYYHLTLSEYNDLIGSTEVAAISGNLQSQITDNTNDIAAIEDNVKEIENLDIDTGTETIDSVTMSTGAVFWDVIKRKGNNIRSGSILANVVNSTVEWSYSGFTNDNGSTGDLDFNVTYSGGDLILQGIATSDNWEVKVFRRAVTF